MTCECYICRGSELEVVWNGRIPPYVPPPRVASSPPRIQAPPSIRRTPVERIVLERLADGQPWTVQELTQGSGRTRYGIRHACDRLCWQGLIDRELHGGGRSKQRGLGRYYTYRLAK